MCNHILCIHAGLVSWVCLLIKQMSIIHTCTLQSSFPPSPCSSNGSNLQLYVTDETWLSLNVNSWSLSLLTSIINSNLLRSCLKEKEEGKKEAHSVKVEAKREQEKDKGKRERWEDAMREERRKGREREHKKESIKRKGDRERESKYVNPLFNIPVLTAITRHTNRKWRLQLDHFTMS